jgi:hypothetical protein
VLSGITSKLIKEAGITYSFSGSYYDNNIKVSAFSASDYE